MDVKTELFMTHLKRISWVSLSTHFSMEMRDKLNNIELLIPRVDIRKHCK